MMPSGFVLAGGQSQRMGRDKGLLPYHGTALVAHLAGIVQLALGAGASVSIIGEEERYRGLGYPAHADVVARSGPLGGVVTALKWTQSDWNLVVACDMPRLSETSLRSLVEVASGSRGVCVAASGPGGEMEPLCAVYHRRCLPTLEQALAERRLKMMDLLAELGAEPVPFPREMLANVNTPEQWKDFEEQPR
jgi:molybdenum cofactor guanylyltransferase